MSKTNSWGEEEGNEGGQRTSGGPLVDKFLKLQMVESSFCLQVC